VAVWLGTALVLGVLYRPFAVDRAEEFVWPQVNLAAYWAMVAVLGVTGVLLAVRHLGRWFCDTALVVCGAGTVAVIVMLPPLDQASGMGWTFGTFGWFAVLLWMDRPVRIIVAVLALPVVLAVGVVLAGAVATPEVVAALLVRGVVVVGPQLAVVVAAAQLHRSAEEAAAADRRARRVQAEETVAEALHADRVRRSAVVMGTIGPVLRELAGGAKSTADREVRSRCLMAAARVRRLLAETQARGDPLVHELSAALAEVQRQGVAIDLAVRGSGSVEPPVEVRRALIDPVLSVVASAETSARVTVVRTAGEVKLAVAADTGPEDDLDWSTAPDPTPTGGTSVWGYHDGDTTWVEATWAAN
jgi:hypothetical protein